MVQSVYYSCRVPEIEVPSPTTACNFSSSSDALFLASAGTLTHTQLHIVKNKIYSPPSPSNKQLGYIINVWRNRVIIEIRNILDEGQEGVRFPLP